LIYPRARDHGAGRIKSREDMIVRRMPTMRRSFVLAIICGVLASGFGGSTAVAKEDGCHLEQQCKWKNFKKICVWVKVCRKEG
jgi:hypothetical protein